MKFCINCGKEISGEKFCIKCGKKIKKSNKKKYFIIVFIILFLGCLMGYIIRFNYTSNIEEQLEHEKNIGLIKQQQQSDMEFTKTQEQKNIGLLENQQQLNKQDKDGDGLTYEEELKLGTDDNNSDSDGDGVQDNEDQHPAGGGENHKITVNWQHNGFEYTTQFGIPEDRYLYYKNQPRGYCCDGWNKFVTPRDITIKTIAEDIYDVAKLKGENPYYVAIDFVESMVYQYDIEYNGRNEYPKYAIETIIDEKGDCEDTSFLMASILKALNIDTILLVFPGHVAVGVYCTGCEGVYFDHNGRKYYFLETTGSPGSWKLGGTTIEYANTLERVIDI